MTRLWLAAHMLPSLHAARSRIHRIARCASGSSNSTADARAALDLKALATEDLSALSAGRRPISEPQQDQRPQQRKHPST